MGTRLNFYFNAFTPESVYILHFLFGQGSHQKVFYIQVANSVGKVKSSTPGHVNGSFWRNYFIGGNMTYTADVVHE
jgi:hypothetical protein